MALISLSDILGISKRYYSLGESLGVILSQHFKSHTLPEEIIKEIKEIKQNFPLKKYFKKKNKNSKTIVNAINQLATHHGFTDFMSYIEYINRENYLACSFFRILQIHLSIVRIMSTKSIMDMEILGRSGIELMSKIYMAKHSKAFYKILEFYDYLKRSKQDIITFEENGAFLEKSIKKKKPEIIEEVKKDFYLKGMSVKRVIDVEAFAWDKFTKEVYGDNPNLKHVRLLQSNYVHSNPDTLCNNFAEWQEGFFSLSDPSGTKNFDLYVKVVHIRWIGFLDKSVNNIISHFNIDGDDYRTLSQDLKKILPQLKIVPVMETFR